MKRMTVQPEMQHERPARRCRGEAGFVGGAEVMLTGAVVFVFGVLLMANAWAVVDAKMSTQTAARESVRYLVESDGDLAGAEAAGRAAFDATSSASLARLDAAQWSGTFARCERVTVTYSYEVPILSIPLIGGWGGSGFEVSASHSEIVDPFRSGLEGEALC